MMDFHMTRRATQRLLGERRETYRPPLVTKPAKNFLFDSVKALTMTMTRARREVVDEAPLEAAQTEADALQLRLTENRLYTLLLAFGKAFINRNPYPLTPDTVVYHLPSEALAAMLGVHRRTVQRCARGLSDRHLIHYAQNHSQTKRGVRVDGTLWCVKLDPRKDFKPLLMAEDFDHPWRDLDGDREKGLVAFNLKMSQSNGVSKTESYQVLLSKYIHFAVNPPTEVFETPVMTVTFSGKTGLCVIGDVADCSLLEAPERVETAAQAITTALADRHSLRYWRRRLWRLWRDGDAGGLRTLQAFCERALADRADGMARKAGALLVSRLAA